MPTSRPEELEDLLQPTLQADADPVHMRGAWNPWTLAALSFFGGPLTAGVLYGENYRRLGRPALLPWCLTGALVLTVTAGYSARWVLDPAADLEAQGGAVHALACVAALVVALAFSNLQQRRFRVFVRNGGEPGSLWLIGLAAVLGGIWLGNFLMLQVLRWTT